MMKSEISFKKVLSHLNKRRRILLDRIDCEGISTLVNNGFTIQEAMTLIENRKNQHVFSSIRTELENGSDLSVFFSEYCPGVYRKYLNGFLKYLNFQNALKLSISIVSGNEKQRKEYTKGLMYPCILFLLTIAGIILFNEICYPPLINMMSGFHTDTGQYMTTHHLLRVFSYTCATGILVLSVVIYIFSLDKYQVISYIFLQKYFPGSPFVQYISADFVRYFLECVKLNISTKESLQIIKTMNQQPIITFITELIENNLSEGQSFESSISLPYFDPSLCKFLKIAVFSSNMEEMLIGYLALSEEKTRILCRRITYVIQCISYTSIGIIMILIYQILMMPLTLLTQI